MSENELAEQLGLKRVEQIKKTLNNADWGKCGIPGMKDVYDYLVDCASFQVTHSLNNKGTEVKIGRFILLRNINSKDVVFALGIIFAIVIAGKDIFLK
jgi:hypothetical protein